MAVWARKSFSDHPKITKLTRLQKMPATNFEKAFFLQSSRMSTVVFNFIVSTVREVFVMSVFSVAFKMCPIWPTIMAMSPCVQPLLETMAGFNGEKKVFGAKIMLLLESKAKKFRHLCFIDTQLPLKMKKQLLVFCYRFKIIFHSLFLSKWLLELEC